MVSLHKPKLAGVRVIGVRLDDAIVRKLNKEADKRNVFVSSLIREIIENYYKEAK